MCDTPTRKKTRKDAMKLPEKLVRMLTYVEEAVDDPDTYCVGWEADGKTFVIRDEELFSTTMLPRFFHDQGRVGKDPDKNFRNFVRNLYRWGFRQVRRSKVRKKTRSSTYGHDSFERGMKDYISLMRSDAGLRRAADLKVARCSLGLQGQQTTAATRPIMMRAIAPAVAAAIPGGKLSDVNAESFLRSAQGTLLLTSHIAARREAAASLIPAIHQSSMPSFSNAIEAIKLQQLKQKLAADRELQLASQVEQHHRLILSTETQHAVACRALFAAQQNQEVVSTISPTLPQAAADPNAMLLNARAGPLDGLLNSRILLPSIPSNSLIPSITKEAQRRLLVQMRLARYHGNQHFLNG